MARFLSQVYTTIRGSVGGITYTANQFQALIARARVCPVNPSTSFQTQMRSAFAGAAQLWRSLTEVQRQGWDDYANTCIYEGPMGTYTIPGRQMMIGNVSTALYLEQRGHMGAPATGIPPVLPGFLDITNVQAVPATTVGTGICIKATFAGSEGWLLFSSRSFAFDGTRYRFKGPFLSSKLDSIPSPIPATLHLEFMGLIVDMIYFTNPRAITVDPPYRMSPLYYLRHIANTVAP